MNLIDKLLNIDMFLFYGDKDHAHFLLTALIQELKNEGVNKTLDKTLKL